MLVSNVPAVRNAGGACFGFMPPSFISLKITIGSTQGRNRPVTAKFRILCPVSVAAPLAALWRGRANTRFSKARGAANNRPPAAFRRGHARAGCLALRGERITGLFSPNGAWPALWIRAAFALTARALEGHPVGGAGVPRPRAL